MCTSKRKLNKKKIKIRKKCVIAHIWCTETNGNVNGQLSPGIGETFSFIKTNTFVGYCVKVIKSRKINYANFQLKVLK